MNLSKHDCNLAVIVIGKMMSNHGVIGFFWMANVGRAKNIL